MAGAAHLTYEEHLITNIPLPNSALRRLATPAQLAEIQHKQVGEQYNTSARRSGTSTQTSSTPPSRTRREGNFGRRAAKFCRPEGAIYNQMLTTGDPVTRTSHTKPTKGGDPAKVDKDWATDSDEESSSSCSSDHVLAPVCKSCFKTFYPFS